RIGWRRRSGASWRMLRSEGASAGNDGGGRGCKTLYGCSTAIECDATGRKSPQQDRSHKPRHEANGGAQCGKSARCVRRGGDWRRGTASAQTGAPVLDPTNVLLSGLIQLVFDVISDPRNFGVVI